LLSERALDGAIIASVPTQTGFLHSALFHEELMLAVPADHPLAAHASARADRLEEREMLFMDEAHCLRNQALESCGRSGRESMTIHATSLQTLLMMVQAGAGIAIVPSMAGEARPRLPRVKFLPFRKPVPTRQIVFAARAESVRGADCEALVAFLKGQERGHQSGAARRSRGI
jgi:LysR family hydrogen peroxide-inducible transcriptional activator